MEAPIVTIVNLFRDNWTSSDTGNLEPKIHTGWFESGAKKPQVTVTDSDENEITGSPTGYSGIGSGNPNKFVSGIALGNSWVTRPKAKEYSDISNPKQLAWKFSEEMDDILIANATNPGGGLDEVGMITRRKIVEPDKDPAVFRFELEIGYTYNK